MDKKRNIPENINELRKENSFSVPEGYFESFQQRLQGRIKSEKEDSIRKRTAIHVPRLVWISGVAAVLIIAFFIARNIIGVGNTQSLSQEEIAYAFEQEIYELDEFELMENLDEISQEQEAGNGYSEEIILYLLDEDIEIDKIVNEL